MSKKNRADQQGYVYSTNPDFSFESALNEAETLPAADQRLTIRLDTKQRAGKAVTLIEGFVGTVSDAEALGKKLKTHCGTGGSVKDQILLVQGDHREKLKAYLSKLGYRVK
jgi:translation initiation factor 1